MKSIVRILDRKRLIAFLSMVLFLAATNIGVHAEEIDNLVHRWVLDETSDNIVYDTAGESNGTYNGTISVDTPYGKGREFELGDYIQTTTKIPLGKKTIEFKVKAELDNKMAILNDAINDRVSPSNNCRGDSIFINEGKLHWKIFNGGTDNVIFDFKSEILINDNKWHDIRLTWDGTKNANAVKMYIDDMDKAHKTTTATALETMTPSVNLTIGATSHTTTYTYNFKGCLSNIEIYNDVYKSVSKPKNLTAIPSTNSITLNWDAVDNADSYVILRSNTAGTIGAIIASDITDTIYVDNDVEVGETYYYVVKAIKDGEESNNSNEANATVKKLDKKMKLVLEVKEQKQLSVTDDLADNTDMTFTSSDTDVATVDANGIVNALKPGNTVITCTNDDGTYIETINVLVIKLELQLAIDLNVGEKCRLTYDDLTNTAKVTWETDDTTIATVSSKGKVTAKGEGLTYITVNDKDGNELGRIYVRVR